MRCLLLYLCIWLYKWFRFGSSHPPSFHRSWSTSFVPSKMKLLVQRYGRPAFWTYVGVSTLDFSMALVVVHQGWMDPWWVPWLARWGIQVVKNKAPDSLDQKRPSLSSSTLPPTTTTTTTTSSAGPTKSIWTSVVIAYAVHKLLLPLRIPLTMAITPSVARFVQQRGWGVMKKTNG
ncbi:hypothetical protein HMI54_000660 [Coelomomyces lativittatus]|nr:hypothetical protein HMI56_005421 [Coelomomyces lativittatus]KAJ1511605.1 hypothetical protein HMI54_000660 [Coelomomyces lativittatus]